MKNYLFLSKNKLFIENECLVTKFIKV